MRRGLAIAAWIALGAEALAKGLKAALEQTGQK
jgi:hypothetical protein